jgi:methylated-DNA-[protein]-cysteine S-methyltransferase
MDPMTPDRTTTLAKLLRTGPDAPFDAATVADALTARARAEGLLDVSYMVEEGSPLGDLLLAATPRGLALIGYPTKRDIEGRLEYLSQKLSPRVLEDRSAFDDVRRQLDEYFAGRRHDFDVPLDFSLVHGFTERVLAATAEIPYGEVSSYAAISSAAGSPKAVRATGNALGANPVPIIVPCHRVLRTGGKLGGYGGGVERKEFLLGLEGALPRKR